MSPYQLKIKSTSRFIAVLLKIGIVVLTVTALLALMAIGILLFSSEHTKSCRIPRYRKQRIHIRNCATVTAHHVSVHAS